MPQVINIADVPLTERPHVRQGVFRSRFLLAGTPGDPGNFALQLVEMPEGYYSPRHRHNFDQIRFQLKGHFDFDKDGQMGPGTVAYFPEGTRYGPQSNEEPSLTLVLQFGGASGSGYISEEQYQQAAAELAEHGTFEKGVYSREDATGRKVNKDAFEAVWEHVNGRPLVYPQPRYGRPVFMESGHFGWVPYGDAPGVEWKPLGTFSEGRTRLAFYRVAPGAELPLGDNAIYFIVNGSGSVADTGFTEHTTIHAGPGETAILTADADTEVFEMGLPSIPTA